MGTPSTQCPRAQLGALSAVPQVPPPPQVGRARVTSLAAGAASSSGAPATDGCACPACRARRASTPPPAQSPRTSAAHGAGGWTSDSAVRKEGAVGTLALVEGDNNVSRRLAQTEGQCLTEDANEEDDTAGLHRLRGEQSAGCSRPAAHPPHRGPGSSWRERRWGLARLVGAPALARNSRTQNDAVRGLSRIIPT